MKRRAVLLMIVAALACQGPQVSRQRWFKMTAGQKRLYVRSLLGAEVARSRKGGSGSPAPADPAVCVTQIDRSYAAGDLHDPGDIFAAIQQEDRRRASR